jgi:hypothetical protein
MAALASASSAVSPAATHPGKFYSDALVPHIDKGNSLDIPISGLAVPTGKMQRIEHVNVIPHLTDKKFSGNLRIHVFLKTVDRPALITP